jgi:hypothetical protein
MNNRSPARLAHERLLAAIPRERITTHERAPTLPGRGKHAFASEAGERAARARWAQAARK